MTGALGPIMKPLSRMPTSTEAPLNRVSPRGVPGRIMSASMSGMLWSWWLEISPIGSTNSTKSRATIVSMAGPVATAR